jgi:hypothetical protein
MIKESTDAPLEEHISIISEITPVTSEMSTVIDKIVDDIIDDNLESTPPVSLPIIQCPMSQPEEKNTLDSETKGDTFVDISEFNTHKPKEEFTDIWYQAYIESKDIVSDVILPIPEPMTLTAIVDTHVRQAMTLSTIIGSSEKFLKSHDAFNQTLPVRIIFVFIVMITCKLSYTLRMRHIIIPFDRGHKNL